MGIKILYAGDSPVGGAANYLLGILSWMKADVTHIPPAKKLTASHLNTRYDVIIFSDYSRVQVSPELQKKITAQVNRGSGFLMIGGWGSFSGPFGGWKGSEIERILPVFCQSSDDRTNFPGGASLYLKNSLGFLNRKIFVPAPAVCGLNRITPKAYGKTLLSVRRVLSNGARVRLEAKPYPLLVVDPRTGSRTAALATDLAPHWCGGLVDWGNKTLKLPVNAKIQVQVGNHYVEFVTSLLRWLAQA